MTTRKNIDMLSCSLWKGIFLFSLPLMVSNLLQMLFNMADVAVVGRFVGSLALGSVGSTTTLVALFTGFLIGTTGSGVNVITARYLGAGQHKDVSETVHTALILCILVGFAVMAVTFFCCPVILGWMGTKPELIDNSILYLKIYSFGMPALAIYNYGNAICSAHGNTKTPLCFLTVAGILNVLLNLFFVLVFHLGVAGVALASILSQYISALLIIIYLFRGENTVRLHWREIRFSPKKARQLLQIGLPSGLQASIFHIANSFILSGVNSFDAVTVSGNAAATNADGPIYTIMDAFYVACSSFISQNYGARKKDRVLKSYFISLLYSFSIGFALSMLLLIFGRQFLSLFTTDRAVMDVGMQRLTIMGFSYAFSAFMDCTIAASRGLGRSLLPTVEVILGSCVFRIVWLYTVFAYFKTIPSLYCLYIFSWIITAVAEIVTFRKAYRQTFPPDSHNCKERNL